ncbi:MAG: PEP-CTERM sorting domain-containing protein [Dechloromonas sp.]|nr:MAG: PEP-CTERM sorting domain-containing protein [Dechloromonas sp.]
MNSKLKHCLIAAALALATGSASAAPVLIKETGLANGLATGGLILPVSSTAQNYWAGLQTLLIDETRSVLAFCVDPWEWSSNLNQSYVTNTLDSVFGSEKASFIRELYSESYSSTLLPGSTGNLNAAGFQVALWEIIADDNLHAPGLQTSLANGLVRKVNGTSNDILQTAQAMLTRIDGIFGQESYSFELFTSGRSLGQGSSAGYQDFLVASRVPEPGMLGLMAGALGSLALVGWRRRRTCRSE